MKYISTIIIISFIAFASCKKETISYTPITPTFERTYGTASADDYATSIGINNGFIYVLGSTDAGHASLYEMCLIKLNNKGDSIWSKTFGGNQNTTGERLIILDDGLLLCGTRIRKGASDKNLYVVKTSFDGILEWEKSIGSSLDEVLYGACKANADGFLLCGFNDATPNGINAFMVRINNNGDTLWTRSYGSMFNDGASDVVASSNGFIVFGFTDTVGNANRNFYLLSLNETGDTINTTIIGGNGYEESQAIIKLKNGNYLISGHTASIDPMHNLFGREVDINLNPVHSYEFGDMMHDGGEGVAQDNNGDYVFLARSDSYGNGDEDIVLFTSTANGILKKTQRFGNNGVQQGYQVIPYKNDLLIAGASRLPGEIKRDFFVVRCND